MSAFVIIWALSANANAQEHDEVLPDNIVLPHLQSSYVEAGVNYHSLTDNYGNWNGQYLKGELQTGQKNRWNFEFINQKEFNDTGTYGAIGNTHIFNEDWFSSITAGVGNNAFFLPEYRIDAFLNRKLLGRRQLVATLGLGKYKAMDEHDDESLFLGASYYFETPWIVQGGIRINKSDPGSVTSTSQFVAVTQGKDKNYFVTARYGFGKEAYQTIGQNQTLVDFHSQEVSLELRKWINPQWGFNIKGQHYTNPNYDRNGIIAGIFKEF